MFEHALSSEEVTGQSEVGRLRALRKAQDFLQDKMREAQADVSEQKALMQQLSKKEMDAANQKLVGLQKAFLEVEGKMAAIMTKEFICNVWQPVPEVIRTTVVSERERINDEVEFNQIRITFTGSEQLSNANASYIKFNLVYADDQERKKYQASFSDYYYCNDTEPREFYHTLRSNRT